jgi:hypothetical protein
LCRSDDLWYYLAELVYHVVGFGARWYYNKAWNVHSSIVAKEVASIDILSNGRCRFGIGKRNLNHVTFQIKNEVLALLKESTSS